jgi:hypothetical protein
MAHATAPPLKPADDNPFVARSARSGGSAATRRRRPASAAGLPREELPRSDDFSVIAAVGWRRSTLRQWCGSDGAQTERAELTGVVAALHARLKRFTPLLFKASEACDTEDEGFYQRHSNA